MKVKHTIYLDPQEDLYVVSKFREFGLRKLASKSKVSSARLSNLLAGRCGMGGEDFNHVFRLVCESFPDLIEFYPDAALIED